MTRQTFPKGFLWGASTAAHQVEGGNHNQWTEWERANAERLAVSAEARYGWLPSWPDVKDQATTPENYISGEAVDHYHLYREDFKLLKQLNMNAFRFSIEWSRIESEEGVWNEQEIEHYRAYLRELKSLGIEPVVTLWHWTLPIWFARKGGFAKRRNIRYFERFATKIAQELGNEFRYVMILNEPSIFAYEGYLTGRKAPGEHNLLLGVYVYYNLTYAYKRAYAALKRVAPQLQLGVAHSMVTARPANGRNPANRLVIKVTWYVTNWWFLDRIRAHLDYIGVNFYFTVYGNWRAQQVNPQKPLSDMGWYMEPSGLEELLVAISRRYHKPVIVTENGVADAKDAQRRWWLKQTLAALHGALKHGVNLRGYLHWSLLDNFEWEQGFWPKFGLIAVDRTTMKRTIRPSARWLAGYSKHHQA